jgi:hypothetical protein
MFEKKIKEVNVIGAEGTREELIGNKMVSGQGQIPFHIMISVEAVS